MPTIRPAVPSADWSPRRVEIDLLQVFSEARFGTLRRDLLCEFAFHGMAFFDRKPGAYAGAELLNELHSFGWGRVPRHQ